MTFLLQKQAFSATLGVHDTFLLHVHLKSHSITNGGKLWWWEMLVNLANDRGFAKFIPAKFYPIKESLNSFALLYWNTSMSYFNHTPTWIVQDQGLPEPTSSLSNFVPPKAIELANTEVEKVKNKGP